MTHLIVGNKNYSSWSLRPWLLLMEKGISFDETKIPLYIEGSKDELLKFSPSGKVPAFEHDGNIVWDSLSICEYIAEVYPETNCWPEGINERSFARSISHEMHSGFFAIRNMLHMNCRLEMIFDDISPQLQSDIDRICEIWRSCRDKYSKSGAYLFGDFTIADAMYAPIVLRFQSYGIKVGGVEREYMDMVLSNSSLKKWVSEGILETEIIEECEIVA